MYMSDTSEPHRGLGYQLRIVNTTRQDLLIIERQLVQ